MVNPYKQIKIWNIIIRYFPNKNPRELFWHKDKKNRKMFLLFGSIKLQYDNMLPITLKKFCGYNIVSGEMHRVISSKPFLILILEK